MYLSSMGYFTSYVPAHAFTEAQKKDRPSKKTTELLLLPPNVIQMKFQYLSQSQNGFYCLHFMMINQCKLKMKFREFNMESQI